MLDCDLASKMGLPEEPDREEFSSACKRGSTESEALHYAACVAALLRTEKEAAVLHSRLKMSAFERDLILHIIQHRRDQSSCSRHWRWLISDAQDVARAKEFAVWTLKYRGERELAEEVGEWRVPKFPVNGLRLVEGGCPRGPAMTLVIKK